MNLLRQSLVAVVAMSVSALAQGGHVARLTSTEGTVHIDRAGDTTGDVAVLNMPLIEGSTVVTGQDGQAEVEFEDGSLARLTPNSTLMLAQIGGASGTQLALAGGLAYFELRAAPSISYTVLAAGDRLHPTENATVRISLDEPPPAIAVLDGTMQVERPGSYATEVRAGETFRADVNGEGRYFLMQGVTPDTWDSWNEMRDQQAADAAARQTDARGGYAGDNGYGWSDLDANGTWYDAGPQGQVWQPSGGGDAGFDPYGNGNWVWYPTAGYVWASAYPWGWTPFRCGSWSYWGGFGWGWAPAGNCVSFGFGGGYGGGGLVNIRLAPRGYPVHRPPSPTRPGLHPIVPVHGDTLLRTSSLTGGPRTINGIRATPLQGTALGYTMRGGSAIGAGLLRDYPMARGTRAPVLGVRPGEGRVSSSGLGTRPVLSSPPGATSGLSETGHRADRLRGDPDRVSGGSTINYPPSQPVYGVMGTARGGSTGSTQPVQRAAPTPGMIRPGQPQNSPVIPVYGRAPVSNAQPQRVQPTYIPRQPAPSPQGSRPMVSAPAPAPRAAAPGPAAAPSGKK